MEKKSKKSISVRGVFFKISKHDFTFIRPGDESIFSTGNKQKLPFTNPLSPASAYVVYEWSLSNAFGATDMVDVEDLYCEVIYCLLHMIGNDSPKVS